MKKVTHRLALAALGAAAVVSAAALYRRFRRDLRAAWARLESAGSQVVDTDCGPIEYARVGAGYPVLVVHGNAGGFDQGLLTATENLGAGFDVVAPSRFGYLRTPLPDQASPASQADAYACLLDVMGIERAAVMGASAGGTSAIQFALRHPKRCAALVLMCSNAPGEIEVALPPQPLANLMFRSDFLFWVLSTYLRPAMLGIMGVPRGFQLTPAQKADVARLMQALLPARPRAAGSVFDTYVSNPDINTGYPFEEISVPTLVINAIDDPLSLYENARAMAERIPGATFVTIQDGGHMMLGHNEKVRSEIRSFLEQHTAAGP